VSYSTSAEHTSGMLDFGRASIGGFLVTVAIFLSVLTLGYLNYARLVWPSAPLPLQVLFGFLVAFSALVLARATAAARLAQRTAGRGGANPAWILFFALLLTISALGTMNALFYFFEGDQVADQRVEQARQQLAQLKADGAQALKVPEYEKLHGAVKVLLGELSDRVFSVGGGGSCGIGPDARETIRKLGAPQLLSGFGVIPFSDRVHNCSQQAELQKIYEQYVQEADRLLQASSVYVDNQVARRESVGATLTSSINTAMQNLSDALGATSSISRGVVRDYRSLQTALMQAADTYRQQLSELRSATGATVYFGRALAPETLDIEDVTQLGNIAFILKSIVLRLDRPQTYFYLLGAIALDAFMVWAFVTVMTDLGASSRASNHRATRQDAEVMVHYLWTRGPH
jgi:hypothetical protein